MSIIIYSTLRWRKKPTTLSRLFMGILLMRFDVGTFDARCEGQTTKRVKLLYLNAKLTKNIISTQCIYF